MRQSAFLLTIFASAASSLMAQQTATVQMEATPPQTGCPVGFTVEQRSAGRVLRAGDHRSAAAAQHLEVRFDRDAHRRIEGAEVAVQGTDGSLHTMLVGTTSSDVEKTFQLRRDANSLSFRQFAVWVDGMSSVRWVKLVTLRYADGSEWHSGPELPCRAEPNRLLLVAGN